MIYQAELGQAVADPLRVFVQGVEEVWTREFDHGFIVVSSIHASNYTVMLPVPVHELPLSSQPGRITGQREAPAWQFVIDNAPPTGMVPAGHDDWWADDANRANFKILQGNWTVVTDQTQSHQFGASFLVGFVEPGGVEGFSQGRPGVFTAAWTFQAPANGLSITHHKSKWCNIWIRDVFCYRIPARWVPEAPPKTRLEPRFCNERS